MKPFVDSGSFLGSIKHNSSYSAMPKDGSMLPDCQIKLIEKWVADGAQIINYKQNHDEQNIYCIAFELWFYPFERAGTIHA